MRLREMYRIAKNPNIELDIRYAMARKMIIRRKLITLERSQPWMVRQNVEALPLGSDVSPDNMAVLLRTRWRREQKRKAVQIR